MHSLEPSKQMYVALLPAYPCTAQTNKYTVKTGISVDIFKNNTPSGVKLTLHVRRATIVARIIIVQIADGNYSCRASINQLKQVQLAWVYY